MTEEEEEEKIIMEKEMKISTTILPREIHMEILSWIPAKSLISSFKFVCKTWRNLIKDPDFIKMHLNRRGAIHGGGGGGGGGGGSLLRKQPRSGKEIFQLHPPFNFDDDQGLVLNPINALAEKIDINSVLLASSISRLVGSCNGLLLCLSDNNRIILLNPSTKKYKILPTLSIDFPTWIFSKPVTYGFGCYYNSTTGIDEYKVVRIAYFYPRDDNDHSFEFQIDIFSMSSNSWRRWRKVKEDVVPYEISLHRSGVFVNGAFHWMGCKLRRGNVWDTIVSFNLRDEEFGPQVPVPPPCEFAIAINEYEFPYIKNDIVLMNVRGYLGNAYFSLTELMDIELEIWVMKEYGIKESWTKEFVIRSSDSDPPSEFFGPLKWSRKFMTCFFTCFFTGDHILIEGRVLFPTQWVEMGKVKGYGPYGRLVLYDINKKKIDWDFRMVDISCVDLDDQVDYIETLVSLKSSVFPLSNKRKGKDMESLRNYRRKSTKG